MISIATSYKNRKPQFIRTLQSIAASKIKDVEVIVVDDASDEPHRLEDLIEQFPFLTVIRVEPYEKWYANPCVAFNKAFAAAKGDKVIIQNPECVHIGDVLQYVEDNLNDTNYLSFAAYSLDQLSTDRLEGLDYNNVDSITQTFCTQSRAVRTEGDVGWYNHSHYRPVGYHFCSAITRDNLTKLGGFDERYAFGHCYDDNEFLFRVRNCAKLSMSIVDSPLVIHQWHYSFNIYSQDNHKEMLAANLELFNQTKQENRINPNDKWRFNVPKILHVYWDKSPLSYLQLLTVITFHYYNPDWQIFVHVPTERYTGDLTWNTPEQKINYNGKDYTDTLLNLPYVTKKDICFADIGFNNTMPEVFKSDFLRWHLLGTTGGCWSDMDIFYTGPMSSITPEGFMIVGEGHKVDTGVCIRDDTDPYSVTGRVLIHIVGFHLACPNNALFKKLSELSPKALNVKNYQSIGSHLLRAVLPQSSTITKHFHTLNVINISSEVVYPFSDKQVDQIFNATNHHLISSRTIGIHWFNGSPISKMYNNEFSNDFGQLKPCTMTDLINNFYETSGLLPIT